MFDVVVIGSANLDLVARTEHPPRPGETVLATDYAEYPGGKGLNQAVAAARAGATTAFVGALGMDDAGAVLRRVAAADGIDTARLATVEGLPTGRALITVSADGDNSIVVVPGANLRTEPSIPECRVLLAQLEVPVTTVQAAFHAAKDQGTVTVLNPAPATELPAALLALTDVVIPNEHELARLGGEEALQDAGVGTIIATLGAAGARVTAGPGDPATDLAAIPAAVVDTTGAGDAFCGAFASRLAGGDSVVEAARWATAAGSLATTRHGAVPSLPTAARISALLGSATAS